MNSVTKSLIHQITMSSIDEIIMRVKSQSAQVDTEIVDSSTKIVKNVVAEATISQDNPVASGLKIGSILLPVRKDVPLEDMVHVPASFAFHDNMGLLNTIALGVKMNWAVLLEGETGVGKTSAIQYVASKCNAPLVRINLNGNSTTDDLFGRVVLDKDGTHFDIGPVVRCIENGWWLVLDEINAVHGDITMCLMALLDSWKLTLAEDGGRVIVPHPDFRFFATMNPSEKYASRKQLDKALKSRFPLVDYVNFPTEALEAKIVSTRINELRDDVKHVTNAMIKDMVKFASDVRNAYKRGQSDFPISTRDLIAWANVAEETLDTLKSAQVAVVNKAPMDEREALMSTLRLKFGLPLAELAKIVRAGNVYTNKNKVFIPAQERIIYNSSGVEQYKIAVLEDIVLTIKKDASQESPYNYSTGSWAQNADPENQELGIAKNYQVILDLGVYKDSRGGQHTVGHTDTLKIPLALFKTVVIE